MRMIFPRWPPLMEKGQTVAHPQRTWKTSKLDQFSLNIVKYSVLMNEVCLAVYTRWSDLKQKQNTLATLLTTSIVHKIINEYFGGKNAKKKLRAKKERQKIDCRVKWWSAGWLVSIQKRMLFAGKRRSDDPNWYRKKKGWLPRRTLHEQKDRPILRRKSPRKVFFWPVRIKNNFSARRCFLLSKKVLNNKIMNKWVQSPK